MIKEAIGIAATIDEARRIATENLNAPIDADVKVEIVSMPKKKVLGLFGGANAKVKAFYDENLSKIKGIRIPTMPEGVTNSYQYYPIVIEEEYPISRNELYEKFKKQKRVHNC